MLHTASDVDQVHQHVVEPAPAPAQVASGDCPHTLFYGPPGAGKKTLILGMLRQIYGPSVQRLKVWWPEAKFNHVSKPPAPAVL